MPETWPLWAVLIGYLSLLFGLAIWSSRSTGDLAGYYLAGRRLPAAVVGFSAASTGESAWLLLGLTGMGYLLGVNALWIVFGEVVATAVAWTFIAPRFKALADRYRAITVADWLEERFGDRRQVLRLIGSLVILVMAGTYMAAQLTGSGKTFESFLGIPYEAGVILGAVVILFYTAFGGLKAVAWSDLMQATLMAAALVALPVVAIVEVGGLGALAERLGALEPGLLRPLGGEGATGRRFAEVASHLGVGLAFLGAPQLLVRFMASKDRRTLSDGGVMAAFVIVLFDVGAVLTGMAGRALHPRIADAEGILPLLASELMPPVVTGLFLVAVLAAIMSTADSVLLLASSSVVRDFFQKLLGTRCPDPAASGIRGAVARLAGDEARLSRFGKGITLVLGVVGIAAALPEARIVFFFVLFSWSGLGCAFAPVAILGICWKRLTLPGAAAGMIAGFFASVGWFLWGKPLFHDLYEMVVGFAAGFAAAIVVSLLTRPDPEGARHIEAARRWAATGGPVPNLPAQTRRS